MLTSRVIQQAIFTLICRKYHGGVMRRPLQRFGRVVAVLPAGIIFSLGVLVFSGAVSAHAQTSDNVSVFATGLDNPRGLKFGPNGYLYVAEGGQGGTTSTAGQCDQVVAPVGPYTSGKTAHISRIDSNGVRTIVVDNLPSSQTSPAQGSFVSGVGDVAFIGDTLYGLLAVPVARTAWRTFLTESSR
jgi:hypothetical protein